MEALTGLHDLHGIMIRSTGKEANMALNITVHSVRGERYTQIIDAGRHTLVADKPEAQGGADRGPGPYSYLLAALGT